MHKQVLCGLIRAHQQEGAAPAEFRGTWHADGLPDAAALVFSTFELLFPDTFQRILPVHKHKVVPRCTPPAKLSTCRPEAELGLAGAVMPQMCGVRSSCMPAQSWLAGHTYS